MASKKVVEDVAEDAVVEDAAPVRRAPATVQKHEDWYLVTYGGWQISVAPDGLIMLPRHLEHGDVDDFVGCMAVARDVAATVVASHHKLQLAAQDRVGLSSRRAILSQGGPPEGAVRMRSVSAQQRSSVIGRARGGS